MFEMKAGNDASPLVSQHRSGPLILVPNEDLMSQQPTAREHLAKVLRLILAPAGDQLETVMSACRLRPIVIHRRPSGSPRRTS